MKIVFWLFVGVAFFYCFYSGIMAAWSYFQVNDVVEQAVREETRSGREERARQVREDILKGAARGGLVLDPRAIDVAAYEGSLAVKVRWSYPVIVYNNDVIVAIPLSVDRSFGHP